MAHGDEGINYATPRLLLRFLKLRLCLRRNSEGSFHLLIRKLMTQQQGVLETIYSTGSPRSFKMYAVKWATDPVGNIENPERLSQVLNKPNFLQDGSHWCCRYHWYIVQCQCVCFCFVQVGDSWSFLAFMTTISLSGLATWDRRHRYTP